MLTVLSAGLPISAKDILTNAMNEVFDGAIAIQELTKENLRSRVRLSSRSVEVVLVILDGVSSDICKDIEGGLYKSDKYYNYVNDKSLVEFLNNKYGLSLVIEDDVDEAVSEIHEEILDTEEERYYIEKIKSKEDTIRNLECRIKELTSLYGLIDEGVSQNESSELRDEIILLNNKVLDLESLSESKSVKISELESLSNSLKEDKVNLENRLKKLSENYDEVVSELNELKVTYSQQSGLIRTKDSKIAELEKKQENYFSVINENKTLKNTIEENKKVISDKDFEISNLKVDMQSKERDIIRYVKELDSLKGLEGVSEQLQSANNMIVSLKGEISSLSSDNDTLKKEVKEKDRVISQLSDSNDTNLLKISNLEKDKEELVERIKSDDESLFELNKEKLELQSKLNLVEKSLKSDNNVDIYIREIQELQNKIANMSSNIFNSIGMCALPSGTLNAKILNSGVKYNNIRFAFAGSAESRKGAYKCLWDEFRDSNNDNRYLIVDLVSETSIDYVFKVKKMVPGMEWFRKGGSVQPYISSTELKNTQVLSVGLGYINDSYFLCIDWAKRLQELDNSGYKVVLFCGDISNLIGRVLHESFASCGNSVIYVIGNAVGSRTLVTNLRGLSNKEDSIVAYFDFNPAMQRFYEMVSKTNECKILSAKNRR